MEISSALFDEWSAAWHANKLKKPNCSVAYKCIAQQPNGKPCEKAASSKTGRSTCWNHRNFKGTLLPSNPK